MIIVSVPRYSQHKLILTEVRTRFIPERGRYGGPGVAGLGYIMLNLRTEVHVFDTCSLIGYRYCKKVILSHVCLFRVAIRINFILMGENAGLHRTSDVQQRL
ncbi:hypothetical protein TNCV_2184951 [Trichonephila clavipes]|nr:hypothetical protein TNCV_2184951 [Trichonephila clavipes]